MTPDRTAGSDTFAVLLRALASALDFTVACKSLISERILPYAHSTRYEPKMRLTTPKTGEGADKTVCYSAVIEYGAVCKRTS